MAWCVLRLQTKDRPPLQSVATNILHRQSQRADKWQSSNLGLGKVLTTHQKNWPFYETDICALDQVLSFGETYAVEKGYEVWYMKCMAPV
jgi:hypothetical protein